MFPRKAGNNLLQDPATIFFGLYTKDASSYYRDTFSTMFITSLFIIATICKKKKKDLSLTEE